MESSKKILKQLAEAHALPEHSRDDSWYRSRRAELQQQKVKLLGNRKIKPRVRMKLKQA